MPPLIRCLVLIFLLAPLARADGIRPLLGKYCLDCHNAETMKGDVDLTHFGSPEKVLEDFKLWQTVLQQIEEEEMPPKKPLPSTAERAELAGWARHALASIDWSKQRGVERVTLPRLNKQEYNNTVRDLLGIDFQPGYRLLDDGPGLSGFTNDRDALFISPALAEQLFDAADYALQSLLNLRAKAVSKRFESEDMLMTERGAKPVDLPGGGFGYSLEGAGQRTLFDEVSVPADGWYRFTVKHVGRGGDAGLRLRIDNEPRALFSCVGDTAQEETMELLLAAGTHQMTWNIDNAHLRVDNPVVPTKARRAPRGGYAVFDQTKAAPQVREAAEKNAPRYPAPADASDEVSKRIDQVNRGFVSMQMRIEYLRAVTPAGNPNDLRSYYNLLPERTDNMAAAKKQLAEALQAPMVEIDQCLRAANREQLASNARVVGDSLEVLGLPFDPDSLIGSSRVANAKPVRVGAPGVDWILVEGPVAPAGAQPRDLFQPDAREALADFLPRAFRRPLRESEIERHLALYEKAKADGEPHDQALKLAFSAALTSPSFLFRDELQAGKLNEHQLASRLSYFLWMSMPDDELHGLADAGELRAEKTLRAQVRRMLADPKSRAFTSTFLGQWLGFAGIGSEHVPDAKKFPVFTPALAEAMKLEPVLVFENLLRTGGSLARLLDSRETFANAGLAALYGIEEVSGEAMQPVSFSDDKRAGLLGMAAVLTASSTPNRTSPVIRGKWVLENLLGRHLAEPPADAGQLDDKAGERGKTLREELAEHRRNESCASCHDKIDPIGFGLENFDAIGRFRAQEAGRPVEAGGVLPGGVEFNGPAELRAVIQSRHQDEFLRNMTQRLAAFALGRALKPRDEGFIRQLLADSKKNGHRADLLVQAIVLSEAFGAQGGN